MNEYKPNFNLNVVLRETGIKADTLRAWERRYGLPNPERTEGGHRLYSTYDIKTIRWLLERQDQGMRISQAVKLWTDLKNQGLDPLEESVAGGEIGDPVVGDSLDQYIQSWVEAVMDFDEKRVESTLSQAFARFTLETVIFDLLQPAMQEVGNLWYRGELTVQQEHFASALVLRRLHALVSAAPPPTRTGSILVACPPEEEHEIPSLVLSLLLRNHGWKVVYLGANVPISDLKEAVASVKPDLVVMHAVQLYTASTLLQAAEALTKEKVTVAYGGRVFNQYASLRDKVPGYFLGEDLRRAVDEIDKITAGLIKRDKTKLVPKEFRQTLEDYSFYAPSIELKLREQMIDVPMDNESIDQALLHFRHDVQAALTFGEMELLKGELDWIKDLLPSRTRPSEWLQMFLSMYRKTLEDTLNGKGQILVDWFSENQTAF